MLGPVPVVQAFALFEITLGHLGAGIDDAGNVTSASGDTIFLEFAVWLC